MRCAGAQESGGLEIKQTGISLVFVSRTKTRDGTAATVGRFWFSNADKHRRQLPQVPFSLPKLSRPLNGAWVGTSHSRNVDLE